MCFGFEIESGGDAGITGFFDLETKAFCVAFDLPVSSGCGGVTGVSSLLTVETGDWGDGVGDSGLSYWSWCV